MDEVIIAAAKEKVKWNSDKWQASNGDVVLVWKYVKKSFSEGLMSYFLETSELFKSS